MVRIVILGAGFGGLETAIQAKLIAPPNVEVILIDKNEKFYMGLTKLWVVTGERQEKECSIDIRRIRHQGINFIRGEVKNILPSSQIVETDTGKLHYDFLVIALGAQLSPALPGFDHALNLFDMSQAEAIYKTLKKISSGVVSICVATTPFKCPGSPYEAAFLTQDFFKRTRKNIRLQLFTPEPQPLPVAGFAVGNAMRSLLEKKDIAYYPNSRLVEIKKTSLLFETGEFPSDVTLLIPPHVAPAVVKKSHLTDTDWIEADRFLKTKFPNIYAIGDVTALKLTNGMLLPKLGIIAEREADIIARNIAAEINGTPKIKFDGKGYCFVEIGEGQATRIDADFFHEPNPVVTMQPPSREFKKSKVEFEKERITRWFS